MAETAAPKVAEEELLRMTADVVAAYVSNNTLPTAQLAEVINAVYNSLRSLEGQSAEPQPEPLKPAVPIRKSVTPDFLICLEDGKKLKMLKRHLRSTYNLTPDEYAPNGGFRWIILWWLQITPSNVRNLPRKSGLGGALDGNRRGDRQARGQRREATGKLVTPPDGP